MRTRLSLFLFIMMICLSSVSAALETTTISVGNVPLVVEVADTIYERSIGLMHRESLPFDRGMLFVYPQAQPMVFWMKNTTIPLSIAFADETGKIIAIMDMAPDDGRAHYPSPGPAKYALEVNRGWFQKHGVKVRDEIRLH